MASTIATNSGFSPPNGSTSLYPEIQGITYNLDILDNQPTFQPLVPSRTPYENLLSEYQIKYSMDLPICNPVHFRQPQNQSTPYQFPQSSNGPIINLTNELSILKNFISQCLPGFNPWDIGEEHPIHNILLKISEKLLNHCKEMSLQDKVSYLENAIAEIMIGSNSLTGELTAYAARLPKFELLEIALRNHLYNGAIYQEKKAIEKFYELNKYLPNNLDQREADLHYFATKNNYYQSPNPYMYPFLIEEIANPLIHDFIENAPIELPLNQAIATNEKKIKEQLESLHLIKDSQCSWQFESNLREGITRKMISELANEYKKEFQTTGSILRDQIYIDVAKLNNFTAANGKFINSSNMAMQLIGETFELPLNGAPFAEVRAKIYQEKEELKLQQEPKLTNPVPKKHCGKLLQWIPLSFFPSVSPSSEQKKTDIEEITRKKLETVDWAERDWDSFLNPNSVYFAHPSAPLMETDLLSEPNDEEQILPPPTNATFQEITQEPPKEISKPATVISLPNPVITAAPKFSAQDPKVPLVSYVDIAFEDLLKNGNEDEKWSSLPPVVQSDVLRHVYYRPSLKGKAEEIARRIFKNDCSTIQQQINRLSRANIPSQDPRLGADFVTQGQELIDFYYSDKVVGQFQNFISRFRQFPKEQLFYQYVYEMAKAANVNIESWDHHFAEYNWDKPGILHLSVQALERCLHTVAKE